MPARRTHTDTEDNARLLDTIFNTTDILMAYLDRQFNFIRVNRAYARADKKPVSFFPGKNHFELFPNGENAKIFRRTVRTGKPYFSYAKPFEYANNPERGVTYWDWSLQPVKEKGRVTGLVLSLMDVTDRINAQISAQKNQAFLDAVIEQNAHPMWISDAAGTVIRMNRALERMLKLKKKEVVRKYNILKDAQVRKQGHLPAVKDVYRNGTTARFLIHYDTGNEPQIHSEENVFRIIDITLSPIFDDNGCISNAVCLQKDITAQVQSEREVSRLNSFYSDILGGIREGIWVTDTRDRIIFFNKGMEKIAGIKAGKVTGLNVLKDFPPETVTQFGRFYRKAKRELSAQPYEAHVTTPAGRATVQSGWLIPRVVGGKYNGIICTIQDVTAQKEAEIRIQHERDRAQGYLDLAEVMFVALDTRGRITMINRKGCRVLGRTAAELLGKSWFANCVPVRMRKDVRAVAQRMFRSAVKSVEYHDNPVITAAGEERLIAWHNTVLRDDSGRITGLLSTGEDITEHRRTENEIRRQRDLLAAITGNSPVGITVVNADGKISFANRSAEEILRLPQKAITARTYRDPQWLIEGIDGGPFPLKDMPFNRVMRTGRPIRDIRHAIKHADGSRTLLSIYGAPLKKGNGAAGMVAVITDITEQYHLENALHVRERQYRDLVENAGSIIMRMTAGGEVTYFNEYAQRFFGYPQKDIVGKNAVGTVFPGKEGDGRSLDWLPGAVAGNPERYTNYEGPCVTRDGRRVYVAWAFKVSGTGDGTELLCIGNDITQMRKAQDERLRAALLWQATFDAMTEAICFISTDGIIMKANRMVAELLNLPMDDIIGAPCCRLLHGREARMDGCLMTKIKDGAKRAGMEIRLGDKWLQVTADPVNDSAGNMVGVVHIMSDITERKRALEALKASERKLQLALEGAVADPFEIDLATGRYEFSDRWAQHLGYGPGEVARTADAINAIMHPDDREQNARLFAALLSGELPNYESEARIRHKDGHWLWIVSRGQVTGRAPDGTPLKVTGTNFDIDRSKQMQLELQEREEYLRSIYQAADNVAFITTDLMGKNTHVLEFSPGAERIFGYTASEIIGSEIAPLHLPEDVKKFPAMQRELRKDGRGFSGEAALVRKNGERFPAMFTLHPKYDAGGNMVGTIGVTIDLTEQKRNEAALMASEERYRSLFSNMTNGFALHRIITNRQGRPVDYEFIEINEAFEKLTGIKRSTALGRRVTDALPGTEKDPADWIGTYGRVALEGVEYSFENYSEVLDKWFAIHAYSPQKGLFATVIEDISKRKAAEMKVLESEGRLRNLAAHLQTVREEERTAVAREIHDELGQLLTAFKMDVSWLERHLPEGWNEGDAKLHGMTELVDRVIGSVKRISARLRPSLLDDLGLYAAMEWQVDEFKRHTGLPCTFRKNISTLIHDDEYGTAVFRVFQEALTNVARHAEATRASASITEKNGSLQVTVRDNGKGIDDARLDDPESYGLLGMRERVLAVGGRVTIRNRPKGGTEVVVVVPLPDHDN